MNFAPGVLPRVQARTRLEACLKKLRGLGFGHRDACEPMRKHKLAGLIKKKIKLY